MRMIFFKLLSPSPTGASIYLRRIDHLTDGKPLRCGHPHLRAELCARRDIRCCSLSMVDDESFWKAIRTDSMPDSNASLH